MCQVANYNSSGTKYAVCVNLSLKRPNYLKHELRWNEPEHYAFEICARHTCVYANVTYGRLQVDATLHDTPS
jgi:hypothetical protein